MTFFDRLKSEYGDKAEEMSKDGCPFEQGYEAENPCKDQEYNHRTSCYDCWHREIPNKDSIGQIPYFIETCQMAIDRFGAEKQLTKAIEEMAELTKELCKYQIGQGSTNHLAEEIADVEIMLNQLVMIFSCPKEVMMWKCNKINRLRKRIEEADE